ncbi:MAG: PIN domain-containing protein [Nanoarchaeota archaeon]
MNLVIDANILFASLIKDGKTIEILLNPFFNFYAPEFLLEEFGKYEKEILRKTHRNKESFLEVFKELKEIITIIPKEYYKEKISIAEKISPDASDFDYVKELEENLAFQGKVVP